MHSDVCKILSKAVRSPKTIHGISFMALSNVAFKLIKNKLKWKWFDKLYGRSVVLILMKSFK